MVSSFRYVEFARQHLGLDVVYSQQATLLCPFHPDSTPSLRFNLRTGLWICLACDARGNIYQLASHLHVSVIDTGVSPEALRRRLVASKRSGGPRAPWTPETALKRFSSHPYWSEDRKFSSQTIYKFQLAWDPVTDRLTIPIRDSRGSLQGIIYRRLDDQRPKYSYPKGFARGRSLFGSWFVKGESRTVVLVEGPLDCINLWNAGIPALAILGSSLSPGQITLLGKLSVTTVLVMMDNDAAGEKASGVALQRLRQSGMIRKLVLYDGDDPGSVLPRELKRAVKEAKVVS